MIKKNRIVEVYGLWFADLIVVWVSFMLATYIRFGNFKDMNDKEIHFQVCLVAVLFCTVYCIIRFPFHYFRPKILFQVLILYYIFLSLFYTSCALKLLRQVTFRYWHSQ